MHDARDEEGELLVLVGAVEWSCQCQVVMDRSVTRRDVCSLISTFHAPSRAARRRWRDAKTASGSMAAAAVERMAAAAKCPLAFDLPTTFFYSERGT